MRYEMKLTVSGMTAEKMAALYAFLDDNKYDYVGSECEYDEREGENISMTMYERIKTMTPNEMQNFIYWCYQNGHNDANNHCEDSPGKCSFFGGGILDYNASCVEKMLDDFYGEGEWR